MHQKGQKRILAISLGGIQWLTRLDNQVLHVMAACMQLLLLMSSRGDYLEVTKPRVRLSAPSRLN